MGWFLLAILVIQFVSAYQGLHARRKQFVYLAMRKRDWETFWLGFADHQVDKARVAIDDKIEFPVQEETHWFSGAAMVYRKCAFHYYFIGLACSMLTGDMSTCVQLSVYVMAGFATIRGHIAVGMAVATIGAVTKFNALMKDFVNTYKDCHEGYVSLVEIADVLNTALDPNSSSSETTDDENGNGLEQARTLLRRYFRH